MATNFQGKNPFVQGYTFISKPVIPKKAKGTTGLDNEFTRLISSDEALVIPEEDFDKVRRTFDRFCENKQITGEYSFRRRKDHRLKIYTIWLEKK